MDYAEFIKQRKEDREGVFIEAAQKLGTAPNNVEKDFWICLLLDAIFMDGSKRWPQLVFRGGTSLSRAYKAINRFSEDIDLAMSRHDLGLNETIDTLDKLEQKARDARLIDLNKAGAEFVGGTIIPHLENYFDKLFSGKAQEMRPSVEINRNDPLTIQIPYISITRGDEYVQTSVRLEFSIRSALKPRVNKTFSPYIADIIPGAEMQLSHIPTITARRTFWDKMLIAHELKDKYLKGQPLVLHNERVSRHYYDLFMLIREKKISINKAQIQLARDCQRHSILFYPNPNVDIKDALPGSFDTIPDDDMTKSLLSDYRRMSTMIFGPPPNFEEIKQTLSMFEHSVNQFRATQDLLNESNEL